VTASASDKQSISPSVHEQMRNAFLKVLIGVACAVSPLSAYARPWTVQDSVELNRITSGAVFSPDQRYFCVVTSRAVLKSNQIESTIWLFDAERVKAFCHAPENQRSGAHKKERQDTPGQAILTMSADTYDEEGYPVTISKIIWASDNEEFFFLARGKKWERRLFSCNVGTAKTKQLSLDGKDVSDYELRKNSVIYLESQPPDPASLYQAGPGPNAPDIVRGTGCSSTELMFPNLARLRYGLVPRTICAVVQGRTRQIVDAGSKAAVSFLSLSPLLSVSPDGRYAVVKAQVKNVPPSWSKYEPKGKDHPRFKADDPSAHSDIHRPEQIKLVDMKLGKFTTLIDAPTGEDAGYYNDSSTVVWAPDGTKVAVGNTFYPIDISDKSKPRLRPCVLVADVATGHVQCVLEKNDDDKEQVPIWDLHWDKLGSVVQVEGDGFIQNYQMGKDGWKPYGARTKSAEAQAKDIQVWPYQEINKRQVLMACPPQRGQTVDDLVKSHKAKVILDPNPQLANVELGEASVFTWHDKEGRECVGGLIKPPNYEKGRLYPLLIQTHSFNKWQFFSCGTFSTGNPGRAMAARGVIVLQAGEPRRNSKYRGTTLEAEKDGRDCYVSAIEQLAKDGLVDPERVGLIGFSRTGWYVLDCLISAPKYFRAATLADANSASYSEYLKSVDFSSDGKSFMDEDFGCKPYGEGLKEWIAKAPGFNTDKIQAPILVELNNPFGLLDWSTYPALRMQNKPVDLLYFRNGSHAESKPKLVFASMETNADWFDFWLNKHEDPDPAKAAQYARWRDLRKLQEQAKQKADAQ